MTANISSQLVLMQTRDGISPHIKKLIQNISPEMIDDETFAYLHEQLRSGRSITDVLTDDGVDVEKIISLSNNSAFEFLLSQDQIQLEKTIEKFIETNALRAAIVKVAKLSETLEAGEMTTQELRDELLKTVSQTKPQSCYTDIDSVFLNMQLNSQKFLDDGSITSIPTGLPNLDRLLDGGFKRGTLTLLGGFSGKGKSCCAMTFAYNMTKAGYKVLYNNLELNGALEEMVIRRFIAIGSYYERVNLSVSDIQYPKNQQQNDMIVELFSKVVRNNIPVLAEIPSLDDLEAEIVCNKYDFVIIDYIGQLAEMADPTVNEYVALKIVSSRLRKIAHDRGVPILGIMQFNKGAKHKEGDKIGSAALKGNDQIKHDSDYFLNINCKYEAKEEEYDLEFEKVRDGGLSGKDVPVRFIRSKQIFIDR